MKRFITFLLVFIFLFAISLNSFVYADPVGFASIAAAAYAMGQDFGFTFAFTNGAAASVQSQMENALETWAEPRGGINVFGLDPVKAVAGKLAVTQMAANAIMMFLQDFKETYNVLSNTEVFPGTIEGGNIREYYDGYGNYGGRGFRIVTTYTDTGFSVALQHSIDGGDWENDVRMSQTNSYTIGSTSYRFLRVNDTEIRPELRVVGIRTTTGYENVWTYTGQKFTPVGGISSIGKASAADFAPTVLNPSQEWQGDIGAAPDTNIDQLIGDVFQDVADTNLDVEGEIVDVEPVPTYPPGTDEIIGGIDDIGGTLDDIGSDVGGIGEDVGDLSGTVDGIGEQVGDISGTLDGIGEQIGDISGTVEGIGEQVGDITESVSGIEDALTDALTPPPIDEKTFDLRELFPFCIPFDIYHLLQKFDGSPVAPHVQLPLVIPSIGFSYTLDLDFSAWDPVAAAMRTVELIVYALGLAWATSKVIKW